MNIPAGAVLAAAFVLSIAPLRATTITSTDFSSWQTSTTGGTHDANFTTIQTISYGPAGYTTSDGFTITGPDGAGSFLQGVTYNGYQSLQSASDAAGNLLVTTPAGGDTALLFLLGSNPPTSTGYTVTLSDGEVFSLAANTTFFGLSVSHPITTATLQASPGSAVILSDVSYGTSTLPLDGGTGGTPDPSAVPEAATSLLLGSGLLGIAVLRKRMFTV